MILAIEPMGNTARFIFYTVGILLLLSAGVGIKFVGERAAHIGLGLGAIFFVSWWTLLARL